MLKRLKTVELVVKTCLEIKPKQQVLIAADDNARSLRIAQQIEWARLGEMLQSGQAQN